MLTTRLQILEDNAVSEVGDEDGAPDHTGGSFYNNFIYRQRGLRGDAGIMLWSSPGTRVYHNTIVQNGT